MISNTIPDLDEQGLRHFGVVTGGIVAVLFGVAIPYLFDMSWPTWPWIVFAVLALWGLIAPATLNPVYRTWMRFGMLMSRVTTPIILTLIFVITILPGALILRLLRKDPMRRKIDDSGALLREMVQFLNTRTHTQ